MMRLGARLVAAILVIATASLLPIPGQAEPFQFDPREKFRSSDGSLRYFLIEESYNLGSPSEVRLNTAVSAQRSNGYSCIEFPSSACPADLLDAHRSLGDGETYPKTHLTFHLVMPACEVAEQTEFCIEEIRIYREGQDPLPARFMKAVDGTTTLGLPDRGIPAGGHISLWEAVPNSAFDGLKVAAVVQVDMDQAMRTTVDGAPAISPFKVNNFTAQIVPYVESIGGQFNAIDRPYSDPDLTGFIQPTALQPGCIWQVSGRCGMRIDSPSGVRYGITIRSGIKLGTFLNGRIVDPQVDVRVLGGLSTLSVDGQPSVVSEFGEAFSPTPDLKEEFPFLDEHSLSTRPYYPNAMDFISSLRSLVQDRASGENTSWRISTAGIESFGPCYDRKSLSGLVTTNATAYSADPPIFKDGYLNYKVAGMHYRSNGSDLALGTYDLILRSDVARCLYGFKNAPISATVAVVGENGEEKVATTVVSEKDGWLKLAAYGFTFSEKEIQVQLRQSQIKTLTNFTSSSLSAKQKAEIGAVLAKSDGNTKFICTGVRYYQQPMSENIKVRARARAACDYAKSINPDFSYWYQTKTTQARSYNGKVMVVSKG